MDTVPIFGAEAPGTAAVEVDVEAPNPATTTTSVVSSIAMDSGVSIFASQKGFSSTGEEIKNVKAALEFCAITKKANRYIWQED